MKNRRHRNRGLQGLALLLSIVLLFVFMPISAVAEVLGQLDVEEEPIVEEIYEVTALREESVKHFYVGEGNYTAVSYGEAVHRLDAVGTWQEIDNTLTLQNGKYQTSDGRVQLAGTAGEELLQLSEKGYRIGLSFATGGADNTAPYALQSVNTANATVQNVTREPVLEGDSAAVKYEKISKVLNRSGLQYTNLLANTDVAYTLHGNDITGRITLRGQRESNDVALRLQLTGLVPTLAADGSILLADATTGEVAYTVPAPAVNDRDLVASYQLVPVSEGLYLLGITTTLRDHISTEDFGSLATPGSGDTAVTLNFGVATRTGTVLNESMDACGYIDPTRPDVDLRYTEEMYFAGSDSGNIGYLMLDLPQIPEETDYMGATLSMWYSQYLPGEEPIDDTDIECDVNVYKATMAWYEMSSWTYAIAETYSNYAMGQSLDNVWCDNSETYFVFNISSAVQDWYGGDAYHGFVVTSECPDAPFYLNHMNYRPYITVTYQYETINIPSGVYYLQNAQLLSCLESSSQATVSGGTSYGTSLKFYDVSNAQKWYITTLSDGFVQIQSVATGGMLTASEKREEASVEVRPADGSDAQKWHIVDVGDGSYRIVSKIYYNVLYDTWGFCIGTTGGGYLPNRDIYLASNIRNFTSEKCWYIKTVSEISEDASGLSVETGLYYVKNAEHEALMQIDNNDDPDYATEGVHLELWGATGAKYQQWRFIYQFDGYYIIQSELSGKVLTVQSGEENEDQKALIQATDTGSNRQRWRVIVTTDGRHKILAKSGESYSTDWCVAAGDGIITPNGRNIEQRDYVNDTNYRDEWMIFTYRHKVNLNVLYEEAYLDRYSNAEERILEELQELQAVYFYNFNIYIDYSDPQLFTSIADEKCSTDKDATCEHGQSCQDSIFQNGDGYESYHGFALREFHHSNIQNIAYHAVADFYSENENYMDETLTVVYIGRKVCANSNDGHIEPGQIVGEYFDDINTLAVANSGSQSSETKTLIHEFGHAYGILDHYGGNYPSADDLNDREGVSIYSENCIYGYFKNVLTSAVMCQGCKSKVFANIDNFQHEILEG